MLTTIVATLALAANALDGSPFAPPPKPQPRLVRLLGPSGAFSAKTLSEFEGESGFAVAFDAYGDASRAASMLKKEGPYDVVVAPGPVIAGEIAAGGLRKIERAGIPNAKRIAAPVAAKLAAYDPSGVYALAWGWSATGLLFDSAKAAALLGAAPNSWGYALTPAMSVKLAACGVALPDARDEMFIAAWRLLGVDPARAREREFKAAADLIIRARAAVRLPVSRDPIAAIAGGAVCLTFGDAAQAGIASRRSSEGGPGVDIRFAEPREGGPMTIDALAEPRDAPHPKEAAALMDFLLRPSVIAEATESAGLTSAEAPATADSVRTLWPVGVYDAALAAIAEREWARTRAPEAPAHKAADKTKAPGKPAGKSAKPTRTKR
jgi:putrescine transport system substrate-binding protein